MGRKVFSRLRAVVKDKKVHLSFYKSTPFFTSKEGKKPLVIRIYRKREDEFEFGKDYEEFFDGSDYHDAEKIFEGVLKEYNKRKYEFIDRDVNTCQTYSYWVGPADSSYPTGPVSVRVRDTDVWWPYKKIERYMDNIAERYKGYVEKKNFGVTVKGYNINGLVAGNRKKMIAFVGVIHAGESGPELLLPALKMILQKNKYLLDNVGIAVLPSVNIDERERLVYGCPWYLRTNVNGVDINRNFDGKWDEIDYSYGLISSDPDSGTYRGRYPESEPETKAVVRFINETHPVAVFSFHSLASICSACFIYTKYAEKDNSYRKKSEILAKRYTEGMYPGEKKEIIIAPGCVGGGLSSYLYLKKGVVGFDLELDNYSEKAKLCLTDLTTPELVKEYQKRHYGGIVSVLKEVAGW